MVRIRVRVMELDESDPKSNPNLHPNPNPDLKIFAILMINLLKEFLVTIRGYRIRVRLERVMIKDRGSLWNVWDALILESKSG
jgi:hypothetical protein